MLGLMPPGATLAFGQGSGPKGSTPLGIRYGGRGHWPEAAGDTGIPWDSCIAGPSGHWPTAASPTLPLSPWERSGQWDSPASAGLPCIRSAKPPRVDKKQTAKMKEEVWVRYLTCVMWSWRSSHYPCRYLPAATSKLLLRRCASHIHTSCLRHDQLLPRPLLSYPGQSIDH